MDCWQNSVAGYSGSGTPCQQYGATGCGRSHTHGGQDLAASAGTPVHAVGDGTVVASGYSNSAGYYIIQSVASTGLGATVHVAYFHLRFDPQQDDPLLLAGTAVAVGDEIGRAGCTGSCSGAHLHVQFQDPDSLGASFCQTYNPRAALPCSGGTPQLARGAGCS